MSTSLGNVVLSLDTDQTKFKKGLDDAHSHAKGVTGAIGGIFDGLGKLGFGIFGVTQLVGAFSGLTQGLLGDALAAEGIAKATDAVIASTKGAAGMSADAVADLATELSKLTPFEDDAIQGAENMLLTFTSIGKEVFPDATETVLNMSQALGQDLKSSAIQLGKALNDPIEGASALRRVGVALTDAQQDQIKAFMTTGDIMSAQKIILGELKTEFGNAARAAGETAAGKMKIFETQIGNVKEAIGGALLPVLSKLMDKLTPLVTAFGLWLPGAFEAMKTAIQPAIAIVMGAIDGLIGIVKDLLGYLDPSNKRDLMREWFGDAGPMIDEVVRSVKWFVIIIQDMVSALQAGGDPLGQLQDDLAEIFGIDIKPLVDAVNTVIDGVSRFIGNLAELRAEFGFYLNALSQAARGNESFSAILGDMGQWIDNVIAGLRGYAEILMTVYAAIFNALGPVIDSLLPSLSSIWETLSSQFAAGTPIMQALGEVFDQVIPILRALGYVVGGVLVVAVGLFVGALGGVVGFIKGVLPGAMQMLTGLLTMLGGMFQTVSSLVIGFVRIIAALIKGDWAGAWKAAEEMVRGMADGVGKIVAGLQTAVMGLFRGLIDGVIGLVKGFIVSIVAFFQGMYDTLVGHSIIPDLIQDIIDFFAGLPGRIAGALADIARTILNSITGEDGWISTVKNGVGQLITDVVSFFAGLPAQLTSLLTDIFNAATKMGDSIKRGLIDGIKGTIEGVTSLAEGLLNALKALINSAVDAINEAIPNDIGFEVLGQWIGIDLPDDPLPHLARGTLNFPGGWAMLGEEGPELAYLPRGAQVYPNDKSKDMVRGGNTYNMTVHTNAPVSTVIDDYALMRALSGA